MTRRNTLMSFGFSAAQAEAVVGFTSTFALAGSTQADATLITTGNAIFTSGSGGAKLPPNPLPGDKVFFVNVSGNTASVYPSSGGTINALSQDAAISITNTKSCVFLAQSATQWRTIPLVPS